MGSSGISSADASGFARGYSNPTGGAGKMTKSIDVNQYAAAISMIKVATENMHAQFAQHLTVFEDKA
jgi:hypothetical protein